MDPPNISHLLQQLTWTNQTFPASYNNRHGPTKHFPPLTTIDMDQPNISRLLQHKIIDCFIYDNPAIFAVLSQMKPSSSLMLYLFMIHINITVIRCLARLKECF